jgi:hypothetical protein
MYKRTDWEVDDSGEGSKRETLLSMMKLKMVYESIVPLSLLKKVDWTLCYPSHHQKKWKAETA